MGPLSSETPIVIIDDDASGLARFASLLGPGRGGCSNVATFPDPAEALAHLPADTTTVVLCEQNLPGSSGLDWLPDMLRATSGPVILMSSNADAALVAKAFRQGVSDFLDKHEVLESPELLYEAVRKALRHHALQQQSGDLTRHLKLTTGELSRRNNRLNQHIANTHRFVENVAHEFRTPLTVIQEYAALAMECTEETADDPPSAYLDHIMSTTRDLAELVDDLLDSSRVRTRSLRVDRRIYTVEQIFEAARPLLITRARSKNIKIIEHVEGSCQVFCDLQKAKRVIINLVINAIKHSPRAATVLIRAEASGNHDVKISVTDSGPGLNPDDVARLGERFRQFGQYSKTKPNGGYGLGLNIAKELIWMNLGQMEVHSDPGEGSMFSFTLPSAEPEHVVRRLISLLGSEFDPLHVTVLHAFSSGGLRDTGKLRSFLAAHCHPMDLILDTMNDGGLVLVGMTAEPDNWIQRLQRTHAALAGTPEALGSETLEFRWLGTWSDGGLHDAVAKAVVDRIVGLRSCA